ncbi:MAG: GNAT family N-acetyltransferase [Schleiferilactobacillus perolens]|uniref:GNAT family N-acetyltransferase n=1 Tax=Schleiferilactobacillus perolens TaxID=100468 RepID=UPI0039E8A060
MEQFEKYHPIMTPRFTFDWLTTATVKEIFALRHDPQLAAQTNRPADDTITQTVDYISQTMLAIMRNQQLTWAVSDREAGKVVGIFAIAPIDADAGQAGLHLEIQPDLLTAATIREIIGHMSAFCFAELGLSSLTIWVPANAPYQDTLVTLGYKADSFTNSDYADFDLYQISRAVSITPPTK